MMIQSAIPVLSISNSEKSEAYYCNILGFKKMFAYRPNPNKKDPCYLGIARDGVCIHLQSFKPERAGMTDTFIYVADVDQLHTEFQAAGATVHLPPTNQTWGTREMGIRDPDGNVLVFANAPKEPKP